MTKNKSRKSKHEVKPHSKHSHNKSSYHDTTSSLGKSEANTLSHTESSPTIQHSSLNKMSTLEAKNPSRSEEPDLIDSTLSSILSNPDNYTFVAGENINFEYSKSKGQLSKSGSSTKNTNEKSDDSPDTKSKSTSTNPDLTEEIKRESDQPQLPHNDPNLIRKVHGPLPPPPPPPSVPPPSSQPCLDKMSFQEFLQSKEVARIHDTAKKFAQLRFQQLQNSPLTDEQRGYVLQDLLEYQQRLFYSQQGMDTSSSNNNTENKGNNSVPVYSQEQLSADLGAIGSLTSVTTVADINAITSLATVAAAAALHQFKTKDIFDFLNDNERIMNNASAKFLETEEPENIDTNSIDASGDITKNTNSDNINNEKTASNESKPSADTSTSSASADNCETHNKNQIHCADKHEDGRHHKQSDINGRNNGLDNESVKGISSSPNSIHFHQQNSHPHNSNSKISIPMSPRSNGSKSNNAQNSKRFETEKIWDTSSVEEKERIQQFWKSLTYEERRELVKIPKQTVMQQMREQKRSNCNCTLCGKKRLAIEELENLYETYNELERFGDEDRLEELSAGEELDEEGSHKNSNEEVFNFSNTFRISGGILSVADDLLKNDGKKFIDMIDQLQQRIQQREEEGAEAIAEYQLDPRGDDDDTGEYTEDDGDEYEDEVASEEEDDVRFFG